VSSHTYATAGTYTWVLTASSSGETCTRSGQITVTGQGPAECTEVYWVPVVSHADGAQGSVWRSDLGLYGAGSGPAAVELRLHDPGGVRSLTANVASGAMVDLQDVVEWIEPGLEATAALEVCSDGRLLVTSRTYNRLASDDACRPDGTLGQYLAGYRVDDGIHAGETATLTHLRENATFRTNIGAVNAGAETATLSVILADGTGQTVAEYEVPLEPGGWWQDNRPFAHRAGLENLDAGSARLRVTSGSGVIVYASVIDNTTNDAATIPMR
jgi:PKD repeat protein